MRICFLFLPALFLLPYLNAQQPETISFPMKRQAVLINKSIEYTGGDILNIAGLNRIRVKYDYSEAAVGNFPNEEEFLKNESSGKSEKEAKIFMEKWKSYPKTEIEPKFEEWFNQHAYKMPLRVSNDSSSFGNDTILLVKAVKLDPDPRLLGGYHSVTLNFIFLAPNQDGLLYYRVTAYGSKEAEIGKRLGECYAVAGKMLARQLTKDFKAKEKAAKK